MLIELRIRAYAVIEELSLTLEPGLNVLSGETGAGKSIIVDALSLLLGERASPQIVRAGAERALIEGVFDLSARPEIRRHLADGGFEVEDDLLVLRREVAREGRSRAWINGSPATAGAVGELGSRLVDIHGQHEHQTLLRPREQRTILDAYAGAEALAAEVRGLHGELETLRRALRERRERRRELAERADFLRFQLGEIEGAQLRPGEEEELEVEARRLEHAGELARGAAELRDVLYEGEGAVADRLAEALRLLERLAALDPALARWREALEESYHLVAEAGRELGAYAHGVEHDPDRLEAIRRRQDLLFRLKGKYGPGLEDVLATGDRLRAELAELDASGEDLTALEARVSETERRLEERAGVLTELRAEAGRRLEEAVEQLLPGLGLPGGRFRVSLEALPAVGPGGRERVEFLVSLNPGFPPGPLSRIASGGELSRVMLALKTILAGVDRVPTLVFDEIDAGIGGKVAGKVAALLREVARHHQVFVVTHLPQLASRADHQLAVEKVAAGDLPGVRVWEVTGEERVREIARMLGGDPESSASREHARELLTGP